jgi:hypothetical protein
MDERCDPAVRAKRGIRFLPESHHGHRETIDFDFTPDQQGNWVCQGRFHAKNKHHSIRGHHHDFDDRSRRAQRLRPIRESG